MPPHDLGFQNVIADVISNHVIALVEKGAILQLTEALGNIGSEAIDQLVRSNIVREIEEKDYARSLHRILQKKAKCEVGKWRVFTWYFTLWFVPYAGLISQISCCFRL